MRRPQNALTQPPFERQRISFEVGDFIVTGPLAGTVEHVGLKTTRIRSLGGEQIVMAKASMISSTIQTYTRLQERRIVFEFGLFDDSPTEAVKKLLASLRRLSRRNRRCASTVLICVVLARKRWSSVAYTSSRTQAATCMDIQRAIKVTALPQEANLWVPGREGVSICGA